MLLLNERGNVYTLGPFVFRSTHISEGVRSSFESAVTQLTDKLFKKPHVSKYVEEFLRPMSDYSAKLLQRSSDEQDRAEDSAQFDVLKARVCPPKLSQMPVRVSLPNQQIVPTNPTRLLAKFQGEFVLLVVVENTGDTFLYCTVSHLSLLFQGISKDEGLVYLGYVFLTSKEEKYNAILAHKDQVLSKETLSADFAEDVLMISVFNQQIFTINLSWLHDCLESLVLGDKPASRLNEVMSRNLISNCSVVAKDPALLGAFLLRNLILTLNQSWVVRIYHLKRAYSYPINAPRAEASSTVACIQMEERKTLLDSVDILIQELSGHHASIIKTINKAGVNFEESTSTLQDLHGKVNRLTEDIAFELKKVFKEHEINSTHFLSSYYQVEKQQDDNYQLHKRISDKLNKISKKNKKIEDSMTRLERLSDLQIPLDMRVTVSNTLEELSESYQNAMKTDIAKVASTDTDKAGHRSAAARHLAAGRRELHQGRRQIFLVGPVVEARIGHRGEHETDQRAA